MLLVHISNILRGVGVLLTKFPPLIYGLRKSGASQAFNYNQHLAEKQKKVQTKRISILMSSLGLHQMKTKKGGAGHVKSRGMTRTVQYPSSKQSSKNKVQATLS